MFSPAYLDHNATTPVAPAVLEAMLPYFTQQYGNASSRHEYGRAARRAIDEARQRVAYAVGAHPTEVIFTSGGSEANNLFIKGAAANQSPGLIAISAIEHPCVREPAKALRQQGWRMREIAVDAHCRLASADFVATLAEQPALISIMLANNETGAVQDIAALAAAAAPAKAWFHSDAVQALGKIPLDFRSLNAAGVHALTLSAHKLGGPKGAGALIVDKRVDLAPLIDGGGHERGLRSGTENVAAIVGFGLACAAAVARLNEFPLQLRQLRNSLERGLVAQGATIFAAQAERLPNTVYFSLPGLDGETLVAKLDRAGYAVSSGAACSAANPANSMASHVLLAMGVASDMARGAVRVSLGHSTSAAEIAGLLQAISATVSQLQALTSVSNAVAG